MTIQRNQIITAHRNPNRHTQRGIGLLESSMREDGYVAPMTAAANGEVLDGNARRETIEQVFPDVEPIVIESDGTRPIVHVRRDIPDSETAIARRIMYRANRIAEIDLSWDATQMLQDAAAGIDLGSLGFDSKEVDEIMRAGGIVGSDVDAEPQIDKADELRVKWGVESGQLWQLGEHRLICGDSTDVELVRQLMGDNKAILFATDPPYGENAGNIGFTAQRDDIEAITKDDLKGEDMQAFLEKCFKAWLPYLDDHCAWYLWHPMLTQGYFTAAAAAAAAADLIIHRQIIWKKEQFIFGRGDYHWRHELCFYGWRKGNRPPFYGERNQDTIWEVSYDVRRSEANHPTAKPVKLFLIPISNHTKQGEICAEPFSGSGSQIMAGEQTGRRVFASEIDPRYVAVSLQRWADATGKMPVLVAS